MNAGVRECGSAGMRECGNAGMRECGEGRRVDALGLSSTKRQRRACYTLDELDYGN